MDKLEVRLQKRMHVSLYALLFLTVLLGISILLEGCSDSCETKIYYTYFEPVYKTHETLSAEIALTAPQAIHGVGKIYRKDQLLFVNDPGAGIHIIDNSNPANPQPKSFLRIDGNYEMAIKDNYLYADNYTDLVVFDISDLEHIQEVKRVNNIFDGFHSFDRYYQSDEKGVITSWEQKERMEISESNCGPNNRPVTDFVYLSEGIALNATSDFKSYATTPGTGSGSGVGGSTARFTVASNFLYSLHGHEIEAFDLANPADPQHTGGTSVAWDIETIFPYRDNLFIGSSTGMYIYSIADPTSPEWVSTFQHVRSCDPVVVDDNFAYVTLRSGNPCAGTANQLDVINIQNLSAPTLVKSYSMTNPHGLGIDNKILFLCDGSDGLKVYDASSVSSIDSHLLKHYKTINAFDVIPWNDVLVMIGEDGLFQYDYSDPNNIQLLSQIPITHAD
jgi:hypothetical protein